MHPERERVMVVSFALWLCARIPPSSKSSLQLGGEALSCVPAHPLPSFSSPPASPPLELARSLAFTPSPSDLIMAWRWLSLTSDVTKAHLETCSFLLLSSCVASSLECVDRVDIVKRCRFKTIRSLKKATDFPQIIFVIFYFLRSAQCFCNS